MSETAAAPLVSYAEIGRAMLWEVTTEVVDYHGIACEITTLSRRDSPTNIVITPITAERYDGEEPVETVDSSHSKTILMWIGAGFHLSLSITQLNRAKEEAAEMFAGVPVG